MNENIIRDFISFVFYYGNDNQIELIKFLERIKKLTEIYIRKFEIIIVNDAMDSNSVKILEDKIREIQFNGKISILNLSKKCNKEIAMQAGVDLSIGDYVFEFDKVRLGYSDELIIQAVQKSHQGNDIITVINTGKIPFLSKIFFGIFNADCTNKISSQMFRLVSRRAINRIAAMNLKLSYRKVQYAQCGLPQKEIYYMDDRSEKTSIKESYLIGMDLLILFTDFFEKLALFLSVICLAFSFAVGVYVCVCYFGINKPVEGWEPTMGFLSAAFFGVFALLGMIVKYLSVLINLMYVKQDYLVESVKKL